MWSKSNRQLSTCVCNSQLRWKRKLHRETGIRCLKENIELGEAVTSMYRSLLSVTDWNKFDVYVIFCQDITETGSWQLFPFLSFIILNSSPRSIVITGSGNNLTAHSKWGIHSKCGFVVNVHELKVCSCSMATTMHDFGFRCLLQLRETFWRTLACSPFSGAKNFVLMQSWQYRFLDSRSLLPQSLSKKHRLFHVFTQSEARICSQRRCGFSVVGKQGTSRGCNTSRSSLQRPHDTWKTNAPLNKLVRAFCCRGFIHHKTEPFFRSFLHD